MKRRFRIFVCWWRGKHETSMYLRKSDQRILITRCDRCGLLLKAVPLSKSQHREMLQSAKAIGYQVPLLNE